MKLISKLVGRKNIAKNDYVIFSSDDYKDLDIATCGPNSMDSWTYRNYSSVNGYFAELVFELDHVNTKNYALNIISIISDDNGKVVFSNSGITRNTLKYEKEYGFYRFNQSIIKQLNNTPGTIYIGVFDKKHGYNQDPVLVSPPIHILPRNISTKDYRIMIDELISFQNVLVENNKSNIGISRNVVSIDIDNQRKLVNRIKDVVHIIDKRPSCKLTEELTKTKANYGKKNSNKILIKQTLAPYRHSFKTTTLKTNIDTYENQMIKYLLISLENRMTAKIESLECENYALSLSDNNAFSKISDNRKIFKNDFVFKTNFDGNSTIIKANNSYIEFLYQSIDDIQELLKLPLFKEVTTQESMKIKKTKVFIDDPNYNLCFKSMKKLAKTLDFIRYKKLLKIYNVQPAHEIYERWCYVHMIRMLLNRKWILTNPEEVKKEFDSVENWNKKDRAFNVKSDLIHQLPNDQWIKLSFFYEERIELSEEKQKLKSNGADYKRPDFTLRFYYNDKIYNVYIDAKHRNYAVQDKSNSDKIFYKDIEDVAIAKYFNSFDDNDEKKAIASFIIHNDNSNEDLYTYFGGGIPESSERKKLYSDLFKELGVIYGNKIINRHHFGSFSFVPENTDNFLIFFMMIMEYHLGIVDVCWKCGEVSNKTDPKKSKIEVSEEKTLSGYFKYKYYCRNCNELWVDTHCSKKNANHPLIKHVPGYEETEEVTFSKPENRLWFVKCPDCDSSYNID